MIIYLIINIAVQIFKVKIISKLFKISLKINNLFEMIKFFIIL